MVQSGKKEKPHLEKGAHDGDSEVTCTSSRDPEPGR
jgi:hypothetical protein